MRLTDKDATLVPATGSGQGIWSALWQPPIWGSMVRSPAFVALALRLRAMRRQDLLVPLASAVAAMASLAFLIRRAEEEANVAEARRLKIEHMRQRAELGHALAHVVEMIGDEPDGERLLADELLDD